MEIPKILESHQELLKSRLCSMQTLPRSSEDFRAKAHSATSVGSNYRACCRARSHKEFIAKMGTVIEESDESEFWLSILIILGHCAKDAEPLRREADELIAIFVAVFVKPPQNINFRF